MNVLIAHYDIDFCDTLYDIRKASPEVQWYLILTITLVLKWALEWNKDWDH